MGILVVGSVGLDDIEAPAGLRSGILGGACSYFSTMASLYTKVSMVGVVGTDFPQEHIGFFQGRGIDTRGLQIVDGKTFFWSGYYGPNLDDAITRDTQLNVFADFHPVIPNSQREAEFVFLANIDPELQIEVLEQVNAPRLTALDSMNFWIDSKKDVLTQALSMVDVVMLNETEVKMYASNNNLFDSARHILALGPKALIIKRGEHGAMLITRGEDRGHSVFMVPAYPSESVVDPTGAGDTFAAGFMGYVAKTGELSSQTLRQAVVHGAIAGSFAVEDFSIGRLRCLTWKEIMARYSEFRCLTYFDTLPESECQVFRQSIL